MRALALLLALMVAAPASASERLEQFGYAVPIGFAPGDALYVLRLPASVYQHGVRSDLGDLRVFNGAGESLPYALREPPRPVSTPEPGIRLPQFPVRGSTSDMAADDLQVQVRRDGAVVSVRAGKGGTRSALRAWLIDASGFEHPIESLELAVAGAADVIAQVSVDASDDLAQWRRIASDAPVLRAQFGGERLEQRRVPLWGARAKYLRIVDVRGEFSFELAEVRAVRTASAPAPVTEMLALGAATADTAKRAWTYDTGGRFPVVQLAFALPEDNTVLPFTLDSRAHADHPWEGAARGVAYRLTQNGVAVTSAPLPVAGTGRHLRIRLAEGAGPLPAAAPSLIAHWQPAELVFAARGAPPFRLAYGKADVEPVRVAIESLVPGYGTTNAMVPRPATAGAEQTLRGTAAAKVAPDFRRWALWAVLVIGVLALAAMGYRLARESGSR